MSEDREQPRRFSRRTFVKVGVAAGAIATTGITGYALLRSLTNPPPAFEVRETFTYIGLEGAKLPVWYEEEGLVGQEARLSHFVPGRGANTVWRIGLDEAGQYVPGTGLPALLIQMEDQTLEFPSDHLREDFIVSGLYAVFDCCTHACCRPGWQVLPRSYFINDLGYDNVYCPCHDSQYNPRRIVEYTHPQSPNASGATYLGIYKEPGIGPANRGMPLIPIELAGDKIVGKLKNPTWYRYLDFRTKELASSSH